MHKFTGLELYISTRRRIFSKSSLLVGIQGRDAKLHNLMSYSLLEAYDNTGKVRDDGRGLGSQIRHFSIGSIVSWLLAVAYIIKLHFMCIIHS